MTAALRVEPGDSWIIEGIVDGSIGADWPDEERARVVDVDRATARTAFRLKARRRLMSWTPPSEVHDVAWAENSRAETSCGIGLGGRAAGYPGAPHEDGMPVVMVDGSGRRYARGGRRWSTCAECLAAQGGGR